MNNWIFSKPKIVRKKYSNNYRTKSDLKNIIGVDTMDFAKRIDLAYLKPDKEKLDTDKLKIVSVK